MRGMNEGLLFVAIAVLMTMSLEAFFNAFVFGYGLAYFTGAMFVGAAVFQTLFASAGALIFLKRVRDFRRLGLLSLALGFLIEFIFMRPPEAEMLMGVVPLTDVGGVVGWVGVSGAYWFLDWGLPAYVLRRSA